jgi:hypothetical protein
MSNLYQIQTEYRDLMAEMEGILADPNPDTLDADMDYLNKKMAINAAEFQCKAEAYAAVIREKEARAEALREEAHRMAQLAKQEDSISEYLKTRLANAMTEQGIEKAALPRFSLSFRKSQAVEIRDQSVLPEEYLRIKPAPAPEPDKTALKKALSQGQIIPGAALVTRQNLQIK